jgi:hypothetical protein
MAVSLLLDISKKVRTCSCPSVSGSIKSLFPATLKDFIVLIFPIESGNLQNNQVEYLPEGVRDLPCINSLNVSHNNLNSMKFAVYLKQLEHLHLSKKCKNLTFPICAGNSCNELLDKSSQVSLCSLSMLSGIKDIPLFDKIIFWMFGFFTVAGGISVSLLSERFISAVNS